MKRILSVILTFSISLMLLSGQTAEDETIRLKQSVGLEDLQENTGEREQSAAEEEQKKGRVTMSVGTSFSYMNGFGSLMGLYAAPAYTLTLNNRWSLHGGVIASSYTGLNSRLYGEEYYSNPTMTSLALFAAASYRMSDRLILHGAGVKHLVSTPVPPLVAYPADNFSFGATYKLGNNVSIGATLHMNRGYGSYYGSPFHGSYYPSPFGW
jgi:hypothetical protein